MIDISQMNEQELLALNRQIVARIRFLRQSREQVQMLEFNIGDRVSFEDRGVPHYGVLHRYNRKTVTVLTEDGGHWNVSPSLLRRVIDVSSTGGMSNVVPLS